MLLSLLLAAAAAPQTAVDAERAFASRAQIAGQWTAFRETAAPDAIMFVPYPTKAQVFFKDFKDPEVAYMWWPAEAYVSCDGKLAVITGPAVRGTYRGYFTTIWKQQPVGGWRWVLDHGDGLANPRPARENPRVRWASCKPNPSPDFNPIKDAATSSFSQGFGVSPDETLSWSWRVRDDGSRVVQVNLWGGDLDLIVLRDEVAAPTR